MLLALLLAASPAVPAASPALPTLAIEATSFKLDNGLTVFLSEDHTVPGVVVNLWYGVGSRDEEPGRSGFAHLFEHLMFMGARYVPYPQFDTLMEQYGGRNNASTSNDLTQYFELGPSNLLELFLWMEADRLATLDREMTAEKLQSQRLVVLNERRQSYENQPYGMAELALYDNLFPKGHPYHWPVIGSSEDLEAASLQDVIDFFRRWYVPSNATMSIVGDFDPAQAEALVRKYFAWLPPKPKPQRPAYPAVTLAEQKRIDLTDQVELPRVILAWPSPPVGTPGDAELDLLSSILARGKAARLYTRLVHELQLAAEVNAYQESMDLQGVFRIEVTGRPGADLDRLVALVDEELARVREQGPTKAELEAARLVLFTRVAHSTETLLGKAFNLNEMFKRYGDPLALPRELERYRAVTPEAMARAAQAVFGPGRVRIDVRPAQGGEGGK